jgi:hypothetical protein
VAALVARGANGVDIERRLRRLRESNPGARPSDLVEQWEALAIEMPPAKAAGAA